MGVDDLGQMVTLFYLIVLGAITLLSLLYAVLGVLCVIWDIVEFAFHAMLYAFRCARRWFGRRIFWRSMDGQSGSWPTNAILTHHIQLTIVAARPCGGGGGGGGGTGGP